MENSAAGKADSEEVAAEAVVGTRTEARKDNLDKTKTTEIFEVRTKM